jgi:hypothetical protein
MGEKVDLSDEKIIEELHTLNNIIRGFAESFDCGDINCNEECPIGTELCLALGKKNLDEKFPSVLTKVKRFLRGR